MFRLTIICLSVFLSCTTKVQDENQNFTLFEEVEEIFQMKGRTIHLFDSLTLFHPVGIRLFDSLIVIKDLQSKNKLLYLIDKKREKYIGSFVDYGRGPGELLSAMSFTQNKLSQSFTIHDSQVQKLWFFPMDSVMNMVDYKPTRYIRTAQNPTNPLMKITEVRWIRQISDSTFLGQVFPAENGRFCLFDKNFSILKSFGKYPPLEKPKASMPEEKFKLVVLGNMYQGKISINREKQKLLTHNIRVDMIEVFDYTTGNNILNIVGPQNNFPVKYQLDERGFARMCDNCKLAYLSVTTNNDYIFALYSGKGRTDPEALSGNIIYQFDWEGNPVCKYQLDRELESLTIDPQSNKIYAIEAFAENPLVVYDLPDLNEN